jgi:hypothetical protein
MENIRLELIDDDQHVRAEAEISEATTNDGFRAFLEKISEEIVPGESARVEVQGFKRDPLIFEVSHSE